MKKFIKPSINHPNKNISKLTPEGITWIVQNAMPIHTLDFKGYAFTFDFDRKVMCLVDLKGQLTLISIRKNPKIPMRKIKKVVTFLYKLNFLRLDDTIFPDLDAINLPFDEQSEPRPIYIFNQTRQA